MVSSRARVTLTPAPTHPPAWLVCATWNQPSFPKFFTTVQASTSPITVQTARIRFGLLGRARRPPRQMAGSAGVRQRHPLASLKPRQSAGRWHQAAAAFSLGLLGSLDDVDEFRLQGGAAHLRMVGTHGAAAAALGTSASSGWLVGAKSDVWQRSQASRSHWEEAAAGLLRRAEPRRRLTHAMLAAGGTPAPACHHSRSRRLPNSQTAVKSTKHKQPAPGSRRCRAAWPGRRSWRRSLHGRGSGRRTRRGEGAGRL